LSSGDFAPDRGFAAFAARLREKGFVISIIALRGPAAPAPLADHDFRPAIPAKIQIASAPSRPGDRGKRGGKGPDAGTRSRLFSPIPILLRIDGDSRFL